MIAPADVPASGLVPGADGPVWHTLSTDRVLQEEKVDDTAKAEPRWRAFIRQYADPSSRPRSPASWVSTARSSPGLSSAP